MSHSKNQTKTLDDTVSCLEHKREYQYAELKGQFSKTVEDYNPVNIIKDVIKDVGGNAIQNNTILETSASLVGGYLVKKIIVGRSNTLTKKLLGYALHYAVSKFISKKLNTSSTNKNNYKQ